MGIVADYSGEPAAFSKTYDAVTQDIDLAAEGGRHARRVRIGIGGTLMVTYPNGRTDTITYQSGDIDSIAVVKISEGSTAQMVTVYW